MNMNVWRLVILGYIAVPVMILTSCGHEVSEVKTQPAVVQEN